MKKKAKKVRRKAQPFPLKEILQREGWTQYRLAKAAGFSEQYVSDLARGRRLPSWKTLLHILTTIGADLGDLRPRKGGAA